MTAERQEQAALDLGLPALVPSGAPARPARASTGPSPESVSSVSVADRAMPAVARPEVVDAYADLLAQARALFARLEDVPEQDRIDLINVLRVDLHAHSPLRGEPVDCVVWVPAEVVAGNDYNPNVVAPPELELLRHSITTDGYTQPIVAFPVAEPGTEFEVVDGFHRHMVGKGDPTISARIRGRLPLAVINADRTELPDRMAATVRHNRARGQHAVDGVADMVVSLNQCGKSDEWIGRELGMAPDEVLRMRQINGIAAMFADEEFSEAWADDGPGKRAQKRSGR